MLEVFYHLGMTLYALFFLGLAVYWFFDVMYYDLTGEIKERNWAIAGMVSSLAVCIGTLAII